MWPLYATQWVIEVLAVHVSEKFSSRPILAPSLKQDEEF
jgi:hypothetical protein